MKTRTIGGRLRLLGYRLLLALTVVTGAVGQTTEKCDDCSELGRKAADLQMQALRAADVLRNIDLLKSQVKGLEDDRLYYLRGTYPALDHARLYEGLSRDAADLAQRTNDPADFQRANDYKNDAVAARQESHNLEVRAAEAAAKKEALQKQIDSAESDAKRLADEAAKAWQAYHDCLKKAKCGPQVDGANKTPTGFSNCPKAQEWLERAAELQKIANQDHEFARQAKASSAQVSGEQKANLLESAKRFEEQARMSESMARERERLAAYELQKCREKSSAATGPTDGGAIAPVAWPFDYPPPGAIPVQRDSEVTASITIENECQTAESYRIETTGLPAGLISADEPLRIDTESKREFPLKYNTKGLAPGLYSGTIAIVCITCDSSCPRPRKEFPIQIYVPGQ